MKMGVGTTCGVMLLASLSTAGCSSDGASSTGPYDDLFAAPPAGAKTTPDLLLGLWGGSVGQSENYNAPGYTQTPWDVRLVVGRDRLTVATRCKSTKASAIVGVDVAARISATAIEVLESKSTSTTLSDGTVCSVSPRPETLPFTIKGTHLTFEGAEFLKLRD